MPSCQLYNLHTCFRVSALLDKNKSLSRTEKVCDTGSPSGQFTLISQQQLTRSFYETRFVYQTTVLKDLICIFISTCFTLIHVYIFIWNKRCQPKRETGWKGSDSSSNIYTLICLKHLFTLSILLCSILLFLNVQGSFNLKKKSV